MPLIKLFTKLMIEIGLKLEYSDPWNQFSRVVAIPSLLNVQTAWPSPAHNFVLVQKEVLPHKLRVWRAQLLNFEKHSYWVTGSSAIHTSGMLKRRKWSLCHQRNAKFCGSLMPPWQLAMQHLCYADAFRSTSVRKHPRSNEPTWPSWQWRTFAIHFFISVLLYGWRTLAIWSHGTSNTSRLFKVVCWFEKLNYSNIFYSQ